MINRSSISQLQEPFFDYDREVCIVYFTRKKSHSSSASIVTDIESDERQLIRLLDQNRRARSAELEKQIVGLMYPQVRQLLRPALTRMFGTAVVGHSQSDRRVGDGQIRFTEVINDFFVKVLEGKADQVWKSTTRQDLLRWSLVVIRNQIRDFLRRQKRGQEILNEIAPLVTNRQTYFEARYRTSFQDFLDTLEQWECGTSDDHKLKARALQLHYLGGMSWKETAEELGLSDEKLKRLRVEAAHDFTMRMNDH